MNYFDEYKTTKKDWRTESAKNFFTLRSFQDPSILVENGIMLSLVNGIASFSSDEHVKILEQFLEKEPRSFSNACSVYKNFSKMNFPLRKSFLATQECRIETALKHYQQKPHLKEARLHATWIAPLVYILMDFKKNNNIENIMSLLSKTDDSLKTAILAYTACELSAKNKVPEIAKIAKAIAISDNIRLTFFFTWYDRLANQPEEQGKVLDVLREMTKDILKSEVREILTQWLRSKGYDQHGIALPQEKKSIFTASPSSKPSPSVETVQSASAFISNQDQEKVLSELASALGSRHRSDKLQQAFVLFNTNPHYTKGIQNLFENYSKNINRPLVVWQATNSSASLDNFYTLLDSKEQQPTTFYLEFEKDYPYLETALSRVSKIYNDDTNISAHTFVIVIRGSKLEAYNYLDNLKGKAKNLRALASRGTRSIEIQ